MDLSKVMAISGKGGLFKIVSQSRGSIIVESLADGKKIPVFATHRSSILEDISMFTYSEDVPLKKVLWAIYQKEDGKNLSLDLNNNNQLKEYFESVLPDYDKERVYASDIKKVFVWYNQLLEHNLISEPKEEETKEEASDEVKEETDAPTEVKKTGTKTAKKEKKDSEE
jgi:hypothetical protein